MAKRLYTAALSSRSTESRYRILRSIVERFGHTKSSEKAKRRLRKMEREGEALFSISRADLRSRPGLWKDGRLSLDPQWLDGNPVAAQLTLRSIGAKH